MQEQFLGPVFCLLTGQPKILKFRGEAYGTNALAEFRRESLSDFSDFPPVRSFKYLNANQIDSVRQFDRAF